MSDFIPVAKVGSIREGRGEAFTVAGRVIAIFNDKGNYFAIDDFCPHLGASLASGELRNGMVACPWHAWRFRICDGTWSDNPRIKTQAFEIQVEGDEIRVRIPEGS